MARMQWKWKRKGISKLSQVLNDLLAIFHFVACTTFILSHGESFPSQATIILWPGETASQDGMGMCLFVNISLEWDNKLEFYCHSIE